jgi:Holliday junction DNA helicase RuvA
MIVHVAGRLVAKELDRVEILTKGGVGYELLIPLSVYETLPKQGEDAVLHTHLVVKEDGWQLFGFSTVFERRVFQKLLGAKGVGPALALGMLSTLSAERVVRAIREKDIATLQGVPRVGRKKAEQLILDLADKLDEVQVDTSITAQRADGAGTEDAVRALISLGYSMGDADRAVRGALDAGAKGLSAADLIRAALANLTSRK